MFLFRCSLFYHFNVLLLLFAVVFTFMFLGHVFMFISIISSGSREAVYLGVIEPYVVPQFGLKKAIQPDVIKECV